LDFQGVELKFSLTFTSCKLVWHKLLIKQLIKTAHADFYFLCTQLAARFIELISARFQESLTELKKVLLRSALLVFL